MTTLQGTLIQVHLIHPLLVEIIVDFGIGQARMCLALDEEVRPALALLGKTVVVQVEPRPLPPEVAGAAMQAWGVRITEAPPAPAPATVPPPGSN